MPRRATGQVLERKRSTGTTFAIRFTLPDGTRQYQTLGGKAEGWDRRQADAQLRHTLSDVERGIWKPPAAEAVEPDADPTLHRFATEWFDEHKAEWRESTRLDYEWQLTHHLLPFFREHRLSQLTIAEVDRYRAAKANESARLKEAYAAWRKTLEDAKDKDARRALLAERPPRGISVTSINKTITRLAQILEVAVERGLIDRNAAKGKRRRLRPVKPAPVWLDSAEQIEALLDAAGTIDRAARPDQRVPRRALLATLVFSGLRISELTELRWRDVDLAGGTITVRASKTDAGMRRIDLLPVLQDELATLKAAEGARAAATSLVFPTQRDGTMNDSNIRTRILAPAVKLANQTREAAGLVPLPDGLTPHKLRHTFASVLVALGTQPEDAMDQLGHTDPVFTFRVYRHQMRRDDQSRGQLRALVGVEDPAKRHHKGTSHEIEGQSEAKEDGRLTTETAG